jgi:hypothetical protein
MKIELVGSTEGIKDLQTAKRFIQNHARICYTDKNWGELVEEGFKEGLMGSLISRGHHSPFDHFNLNFYFDGPEKALAMIFNNQGVYTTSEKSARYTVMKGIPEKQMQLYEKWDRWFFDEMGKRFPESEFPKLHQKGSDGKTTAEKLAQENARYMTSVFTPTKMTHSVSLRQTNILYHWFNDFIAENENGSDEFKRRLSGAMKGFVESEEVKKWIIDEAQVKMKGDIPLKFFRPEVEEHFGEDVYSTNYLASFASLAQLHRHRLITHTVSYGFQKGAPLGFYLPRLIESDDKVTEWLDDVYSVARNDFPQAQLLCVGERGLREYLPAKTEERECGLAQLETARIVDHVLEGYVTDVPAIGSLIQPSCAKGGCKKGGCTFGAKNYLERLV